MTRGAVTGSLMMSQSPRGEQMTAISGNPEALTAFSESVLPTIAPVIDAAEVANAKITAFNNAPSDLPLSILDWTGVVIARAEDMEANDQLAADFARALELADANGITAYDGSVTDERLFAALLDAVRSDQFASDRAVWEAAMEQLADDLADDFSDLIDEVGADREDVQYIQDELLRMIQNLRSNYMHSGEMPSDEALVNEAFRILGEQGIDSPLDEGQLEQLSALTETLSNVSEDAAFAPAFFDHLGPDDALAAAELAGYAAWSNELRGTTTYPSPTTTVNVLSSTMATASNNGLSHDWLEQLIDAGIDDHTLNDAFPTLFTEGELHRDWAITVGEVGIDVLDGEREGVGDLEIDKGVSSPFFAGFDVAETSWRERGAFLLDAAARTPEAANVLVQEHADVLVDSDFADRDGDLWVHHDTDFDAIGGALRNLIVAGTVTYAEVDPVEAADGAAAIMNEAAKEGPGDAADALAPAYADIVVHYLDDFGNAVPGTSHGVSTDHGELHGSLIDFARFTSLAMGDEDGRNAILGQRESVITGLVVIDRTVGLDIAAGRDEADLATQVGTLDAILLAALNEHDLGVAAEEQADAEAYNGNVDLVRDSVMTLLPTGRIPAVGKPLTDHLINGLSDDLLHRPTNQVSLAERQLNSGAYDHFSTQEQFLIAGELTVAVNQQAMGEPLTPRERDLLESARQAFGDDYVDALESHADPEQPDRAVPEISAFDAANWAHDNRDEAIRDAAAETNTLLPLFPDGLY